MRYHRLASMLHRYYTRDENRHRIRFANGMSLNRLAHAIGTEPSHLSRILSGERPFTDGQFNAFCDVLTLSDHERIALTDTLVEEVLARDGFAIASRLSDFVEIVEGEIQNIRNIRVRGDPHSAVNQVDHLMRTVGRMLQEGTGSPAERRVLGKNAALLLTEKARAYNRILIPEEIGVASSRIVFQMAEIARMSGEGYALNLADFTHGNALYNLGRYDESRRFLEEACAGLTDPELRLAALRTLVIDAGQMGDDSAIKGLEGEIRAAIEAGLVGNPYQAVETLEGLARAQGLVRDARGFDTAEEAEHVAHRLQRSGRGVAVEPLIQLARTRLEILRVVDPTASAMMDRIAEAGLQLAEEHGYRKHTAVIRRLRPDGSQH